MLFRMSRRVPAMLVLLYPAKWPVRTFTRWKRAPEAPCSRWETGGRASARQCPTRPAEAAAAGESFCDTSCNLGYARGECASFPEGDGPDAVRFTVSSHEGAVIGISYVVERDHHPFAHGRLEYSTAAAVFVTPPETATLARQAQAYVESYLRRKEES